MILGASKKTVSAILALLVLPAIWGCASPPEKTAAPPAKTVRFPPPKAEEPETPYSKVNKTLPLSAVRSPEIYVYKSERKLLVVQDDTLVREYPVGLGGAPRGDKSYQGDGRTPEGKFSVCMRNHSSRFYKSLGLDYPTRRHAEEALFSGDISPEEYRVIVSALRRNELPPWSTSMGGAIFIHGGGSEGDWTEGCVAVNNTHMDELFRIVPVGTPVYVMP